MEIKPGGSVSQELSDLRVRSSIFNRTLERIDNVTLEAEIKKFLEYSKARLYKN